MLFDIPINIKVEATNEFKAEELVFDFLKKAMKEFGNEQGITDWQYFEFIAKESCGCGCRDLDQQQG